LGERETNVGAFEGQARAPESFQLSDPSLHRLRREIPDIPAPV